MTLLGAGEIIGGSIIGWIRDKTGNKVAFISEMVLCLCGFACILMTNIN